MCQYRSAAFRSSKLAITNDDGFGFDADLYGGGRRGQKRMLDDYGGGGGGGGKKFVLNKALCAQWRNTRSLLPFLKSKCSDLSFIQN